MIHIVFQIIPQINLLVLGTDMLCQFSLYFFVSSAITSAIRYESPLTPANSKNPNTHMNPFPMRFLCLLYIDYILFTHKMGQEEAASIFWQRLQLTGPLGGHHAAATAALQGSPRPSKTSLSRHQQNKAAATSGLGQLLPACYLISGDRNQNTSRAKYFCGLKRGTGC